ncbi:hypothetical protein [Photorhabdus heterorhabditis]|uniref:hypothetical protein n=1 Tax=Photorhabdus heterorhabditis TaxID=880156 RepID=UPI001562C87F|nr:hypothetical protein [Photorhabdus heterorhabditis]NRN28519.1 hypothetical protein [Photorhabdus heterorhabditis subsp. aluminescens]
MKMHNNINTINSEINLLSANASELEKKYFPLLEKINRIKNTPENLKEHKSIRSQLSAIQHESEKLRTDVNVKSDNINQLQRWVKNDNQNISKLTKAMESLSNLKNLGGETELRLKNGKLKPVNTGCIKNIIHKNRYAEEKAQAKDEYNSGDNNLSINFMKEKIKSTKEDITKSESEISKLKDDIKPIQKKIDELKNQKQVLDEKDSSLKEKTALKYKPAEMELKEVENKLNNIQSKKLKLEAKLVEYHKKASARLLEFGRIYHSNAGCSVLNKAAREIYRKNNLSNLPRISSTAIYNEYHKAHADNYRSGEWKELKSLIEQSCRGDTKDIVQAATDDLYQPQKKMIKTFRGQGITEAGYNKLVKSFENIKKKNPEQIPVFKAAQFFSTSKTKSVAEGFSVAGTGERAILFVVQGNSGRNLSVDHGLQFNNGGENEILYSPKACFGVSKIEGNTIYLQETKYYEDAPVMPYE